MTVNAEDGKVGIHKAGTCQLPSICAHPGLPPQAPGHMSSSPLFIHIVTAAKHFPDDLKETLTVLLPRASTTWCFHPAPAVSLRNF